MIILLGVLDFSHVKTTNPADFVVSNRKKQEVDSNQIYREWYKQEIINN